MFIAWTTLATQTDAEKLAADAVELGFAVCVQVEGPIISHYRWQGRPERTEEFRLCLKCLPDKLSALETHVLTHHPYDTPEWIVVGAEHVGEKYLSWARSNPNNSPL
jgi:periplasmic divalent cation tolerance protein